MHSSSLSLLLPSFQNSNTMIACMWFVFQESSVALATNTWLELQMVTLSLDGQCTTLMKSTSSGWPIFQTYFPPNQHLYPSNRPKPIMISWARTKYPINSKCCCFPYKLAENHPPTTFRFYFHLHSDWAIIPLWVFFDSPQATLLQLWKVYHQS